MNSTGQLIRCAMTAAVIAATTPAWAQSKLDGDAMRMWGGTYSTNCGNPAAPRLRVVSDALVIEQNNKRMTGRNWVVGCFVIALSLTTRTAIVSFSIREGRTGWGSLRCTIASC